jgi:hypothetical protein
VSGSGSRRTSRTSNCGAAISAANGRLVVWSAQVTPPDGTHPVPVGCAAWVPGVHGEEPLQPVDYLEVRRMQLPAEPAEWPAPVDRPGAHFRGYLGILDGAEPQLPAEAARAWGTDQGGAYG